MLVPLDGSQLADKALVHAIETFDCQITVLNVVTTLDGAMSEGSIVAVDQNRLEEARKRAEGLVQAAQQRSDSNNQSIETTVETGDPSETILSYVENNDVDHIVMGSNGGDGGEMTRRLLGTVSTAVIAEAPIPVTVVR